MPLAAICLVGVPQSGVTAPDVLLGRHRLKVVGVYTTANPAQMIDLKSITDGALGDGIRGPMRGQHMSTMWNLTVSSMIYSAKPNPTSGFGDYLETPKFLFDGELSSRHTTNAITEGHFVVHL